MKIKNICIITSQYPSTTRIVYTFLEQLINKFRDSGINCYVIAPQSISRKLLKGYKANKKEYTRITDRGLKVNVYSPFYLTFSRKLIKLNLHCFENIVKKQFAKLNKKVTFDAIYAHFIFPSAITANDIGKKYNIPVFFAYGESKSYTMDFLGKEKTRELLDGIKGVIAVSNANKSRLIENKIVPEELIKVFPNGINNKIFYKKDKKLMRKKLGYSENDFIIAFVGRFISAKGIDRLCEALNLINNRNIKAILIGNGGIKPNYRRIIFEGTLEQTQIVDYLSASDIFVLPTVAEGCCNAIIEALACGLPVISSNQSFNDEILDESCSIRIDTMNVEEIKLSIEKLYNDNNLRKKLSNGALKKVENFNIDVRAKKIINYMEKTI